MNPPKFCAHGPLGVANVEPITPMVKSGTTVTLGLFPRKPIDSPEVKNVCWGLFGMLVIALVVSGVVDLVEGRRK